MASAKSIKIAADIEIQALGNMLGLLIALGGLLAGSMVREASLGYWPEDVVPLALAGLMGIRTIRSLTATFLAGQAAPARLAAAGQRQTVAAEPVAMAQLPRKSTAPDLTPEQVMAEVSKRIETNKAKSAARK